MQDRQISRFLEENGFIDFGMISFEKPNDQVRLSQVLETGSIPPQYYLSAKACAGVLRRAEKRGRSLPPLLQTALERVAQTTIKGKQGI